MRQRGLFDHPYVDPNAADAAVKTNRDLTRKAAVQVDSATAAFSVEK